MSSAMKTPTPLYNSKASPNSDASRSTEDYFQLRENVIPLTIIAIEILMICLAILASCIVMIKSKQTAPVLIINLLIADLIKIVCMVIIILTFPHDNIHEESFLKSINKDFNGNIQAIILATIYIHIFVYVTHLYFMACIAVERYKMIAHSNCHRSHHSVKCHVCTSLIGWLMPLTFIVIFNKRPLLYTMPFIPYVVIIVCFALACWSLSRSTSLTPLKKRLFLAPLFLLLISYTCFILPLIIVLFLEMKLVNLSDDVYEFIGYLLLLNPVVDCLLCVFMRSDVENIIRTSHCCCKPKTNPTETQNMMMTIVEQGDLHVSADGVYSNSSSQPV